MRVHTNLPVVVVFEIRTPHSLEKEHVEVHVYFKLFDQLDGQLAFIVREGAIFKVFTWLAAWLEIRRTKLGLVLVRMVKLFNAVVGPVTLVPSRAAISSHQRTRFRLVSSKRAAAVFVVIMVEWASLEVVLLLLWLLFAWLDFERI